MHASIRTVFLALVLCGLAPNVSAQEYCVTCTGPDAKYRCIVGGEAAPATRTERGQLLCITELAKSGGHESCSVGAITSGPCQGDLRTVMFPSVPEPAPPPLAATPPQEPLHSPAPSGEGAPATLADAPQEPQPPADGPPETVEELAKKTVKASGEGLKKAGKAVTDTAQSAGSAVGNAVKKTWTCVSSFFGDC